MPTSEFVVKFEGVKLPPEAEARIAAAVQGAAMIELARLEIAPSVVFQVPPRKIWLGLWIRSLKGVEKELAIPKLEIRTL